ncbi:MAG: transposase [Chloroflexi bacterium]|nr:transposase [Chloroflexota bacterium]MBP7041777.1 transposase [Chloroflexota bacterium]
MNKFDPNKHHRRSIRLQGWDYRSPGLYFVTICTHERQNLFDNPEFRDIAVFALARIPEQEHAQHVFIDESMVMPNHAHVIFDFIDYAAKANLSMEPGNFENALAGSLGVVVGRYKTAVTTRIHKLRHSTGAKVWQRGYYERIICNERELQATRQYIIDNPARWAEDRDNLDALLANMTYHP